MTDFSRRDKLAVVSLTFRRPPIVAAALAVFAALGIALPYMTSDQPPAAAADAETAQLISYFNQYRGSQGVGSLTTSASLNANAQSGAEEAVTACGFLLPSGPGLKWAAAFHPTADSLWDAYHGDPDDAQDGDQEVLDMIADPDYGSVGVGHATNHSCNFVDYWVIILDEGGGGPPLTPTDTPTPTAAPTPSPTPKPQIRGDINCDGAVDLTDAVELLRALGIGVTGAECETFADLDCANGIDTGDVLAVLRYLGGIVAALPDGCPPIGTAVAP